MSAIPYCDDTLELTSGCVPVSAGCRECWAKRYAEGRGSRFYPQGFGHITVHPERLAVPLKRRKPTVYFVCSRSDLFHEAVPDEFIDKVFAVMALAPRHRFLILTKRPERALAYLTMPNREPVSGSSTRNWIAMTALHMCLEDTWANPNSKLGDGLLTEANGGGLTIWPLPNVWLGTSVEDQATADARIPLLLDTPAGHRWVSYEPALEAASLCPTWLGEGKVEWVVAGGESGPRHRPCNWVWLQDVAQQCVFGGAKYYCKQGAGRYPGRQYDIPDALWARKEKAWNSPTS